jgi:CBS-domain-containing membrane protein
MGPNFCFDRGSDWGRHRSGEHGVLIHRYGISVSVHPVRDFDCHSVLALCGSSPSTAALAFGVAIIAMHLTGTFHPPAGIDPLIVVQNQMSWTFLVVPIGIGALLLALFALVWHNLVTRLTKRGDSWPTRWW